MKDEKPVVSHYEIIVRVPVGTSHRDIIEAWLNSADMHQELDDLIARQHEDSAAEVEIDVTNNICVCPECRGQHEIEEVYEMDEEAEITA